MILRLHPEPPSTVMTTENPFGSMHYNAIGPWLKGRFGQRIIKLSLDGGFTCPNRDGSKGFGGCSFCSEAGSGDFAGDFRKADPAGTPSDAAAKDHPGACTPVKQQMDAQISLLSRKWPEAAYIAYFQNYTNTYGPAEKLRGLWEDALSYPDVKGLAVATRPDCLQPEVLHLLSEFNQRTFLWVELGLQTSKESTAAAFNRCYGNEAYEEAVMALNALGIRYVTHLIIGLPGESREDMLESARYVLQTRPFGIKLHMLHLMKGTRMGEEYKASPWPLPTMEEYVSLIADILEMAPPKTTIHRLTGDAPQSLLIAPEWTRSKHAVLNALQQEFKKRGTWQGAKYAEIQ